MNNKLYTIMTRNAKGRVLEAGVQNIVEENNLVRACQIEPDTTFTIVRFDLYTNRALVNCKKGNKIFTAFFDFDFLSENCLVVNNDKNQVIESVYLPKYEIDTKLKFTRYEVGMGLTGAILFGIIIGTVLIGVSTWLI